MRVLMFLVGALLAIPGSASAGDLISGTNTYTTVERWWNTTDGSGYYMYDSEGQFGAMSGPIPDGPVECHGAGFWSPKMIDGEGICIFGAPPDRWTVQFKNELMPRAARGTEAFRRKGVWTVVNGSGKYFGMTGYGTFATGPTVDMKKTTHWEGEVELPQ